MVVVWSIAAVADSATADETVAPSSESQSNPGVVVSGDPGNVTAETTPIPAIADEIASETVISEAPPSADGNLPAPASITPSENGEQTAADLMPLPPENDASDREADVTTAQAESEDAEEVEESGSVGNAAPGGDGVLRFTVTGTRNRLPVNDLPATVTVFEV
ncbi:MAG: hypothetical protein AAGF75_10090, partial [Cyanobacteria bacterium P01_H01_bin.130]